MIRLIARYGAVLLAALTAGAALAQTGEGTGNELAGAVAGEGTGRAAPTQEGSGAGLAPGEGTGEAPAAEGTDASLALEGTGEAAAASFAATVRVELVDEAGRRSPAPGVRVEVEARTGDVAAIEADEAGIARFDLTPGDAPFVARATRDDLTFRAIELVAPSTPEVDLLLYPVTSDPSAIRARRLITTARPHEDFLIFQQFWFLYTDAPYVYRAAADDPNAGLEIRLPPGVAGIHLVAPDSPDQDEAIAGDTGVRLRGPIGPLSSLDREGPTVVVDYSLPNETPNHRYAQTMPVPVDEAVVLIPQRTEFARLPHIDVELLVPVCGRGTTPAQTVCFGDVAVGGPFELLPGIDRREVWGGQGEAGAVLLFQTRGWPMHGDPLTLVAGIAALMVVAAGCFLLWREGRRRRERVPAQALPAEALQAERLRLLEALHRAREEHEQGLLPRSELELTDLVIRHRLEVIYAALGISPAHSDNGSPNGPEAADELAAGRSAQPRG